MGDFTGNVYTDSDVSNPSSDDPSKNTATAKVNVDAVTPSVFSSEMDRQLSDIAGNRQLTKEQNKLLKDGAEEIKAKMEASGFNSLYKESVKKIINGNKSGGTLGDAFNPEATFNRSTPAMIENQLRQFKAILPAEQYEQMYKKAEQITPELKYSP